MAEDTPQWLKVPTEPVREESFEEYWERPVPAPAELPPSADVIAGIRGLIDEGDLALAPEFEGVLEQRLVDLEAMADRGNASQTGSPGFADYAASLFALYELDSARELSEMFGKYLPSSRRR